MSLKLLTFIRISIALIGMVLALGFHTLYAAGRPLARKLYILALIVCAAAALYTYLEVGPQFHATTAERVMNPHDFYHYYVGAKYQRELGYFDLYECSLLADRETTRTIEPTWTIRDLRTYGYRSASKVFEAPENCRQAFSKSRWHRFKKDIRFLSSLLSPTRWNMVLKDKGYNATPVWTRFASAITNLIPLDSAAGLWTLLSIDYVYTAIAFLLVGLTFGWRNALFVIAFWGVNFMTSVGFVKGSLSRLDWLLCLIGALCMLKRGRYAGAGVLAGLATALRIFPALFFVGMCSKAIWEILRTRRVPANYLRFLVGFLASLVLLVGATSLTSHDRQRWQDFGVKITSHDKQIAGYRVGFKYAQLDPNTKGRLKAYDELQSKRQMWWVAQILMLAGVVVASRRLEDHETLGVSFLCVFFLTAPTFYYYQMLVIPFMLFLPDARRKPLSLGMAAFFAWCVLCYSLRQMWPLGMTLSHWLSWSLIWLCALIVLIAVTVRRDDSTGGECASSRIPE